jgi:hypothetical protein
MRHALATLLLAAATLVPRAVDAQAPALLMEQGVLFDANGDPVNTAVPMVFSLYATPTDTNAVWSETHTVTPDQGVFSVVLGELSPIDPAALFDGGPMYLGVRVGSDSEMTPRETLVSVPYALHAGTAEDVVGDIHPTSVSVNGALVIDATGRWVGDSTGLVGPPGADGAPGAQGPPRCSRCSRRSRRSGPAWCQWGAWRSGPARCQRCSWR